MVSFTARDHNPAEPHAHTAAVVPAAMATALCNTGSTCSGSSAGGSSNGREDDLKAEAGFANLTALCMDIIALATDTEDEDDLDEEIPEATNDDDPLTTPLMPD